MLALGLLLIFIAKGFPWSRTITLQRCNLLRFCCSTPRTKFKCATAKKGPFLLNEWMHSLVLTSFMFSIHSFTAACGCGQGDYTNACNILIHSAFLEDLMISSCSHVEVFPTHSSQIRKKDFVSHLALCLNNTRILSQWLSFFFSLSRSFHIYGRIFLMSQSQKHLSRLKCLLSKRIVHAAIFLSQELHIDTDHALDQHSTLRRPSPHFIPLERPLRLVKCPLSRCSHEPFVLTLRFSLFLKLIRLARCA